MHAACLGVATQVWLWRTAYVFERFPRIVCRLAQCRSRHRCGGGRAGPQPHLEVAHGRTGRRSGLVHARSSPSRSRGQTRPGVAARPRPRRQHRGEQAYVQRGSRLSARGLRVCRLQHPAVGASAGLVGLMTALHMHCSTLHVAPVGALAVHALQACARAVLNAGVAQHSRDRSRRLQRWSPCRPCPCPRRRRAKLHAHASDAL